MSTSERPVYLTEEEVSEWVRVPVNTLRDWRAKRINIPWVPLGRRVRYIEESVAAYLKSIEVQVVQEEAA